MEIIYETLDSAVANSVTLSNVRETLAIVVNSVTLLNVRTTKYGMIYEILVSVHNP